MGDNKRLIYEFCGFRLDPAGRSLLRLGAAVPLTPKAFDTLVFLAQNPGRLLDKDELMRVLWPGSFVEESNLSQNIFLLRKALGDDRNGHSFIQTIPRRGYQFVAPVTQIIATEAEKSGLAEYWRTHSPFRSLQVFEPEDAWLFFGRDEEMLELVTRLHRSPVLAIVGNSGCGKSSLLRAGLMAALQAGRDGSAEPKPWRIVLFRPSAAPFDYLAETLPHQLAPELEVTEQAEFIAELRGKLPSGGNALRDAVSALVNAVQDPVQVEDRPKPARVLLVVDQFEEIFTLTGRQEARDRYIDALLAAAQLESAIPVYLVLALRADFYGHCLEHAELSRCLETNLYNVPRMRPEQLRETIEKRLQLAGGDAEAGLISTLLEDVGIEPGNLALMEHALGQLWEACAGSGGTLTNQAYEKIGRLRGALGRHADKIYQGLGDEKQKIQARRIFLELVHLGEGAQDTRRRLRKESLLGLGAPEEIERLLGQLASSRLISISRQRNETFVEVSHEALIREWPALGEWLAQNREEVALGRRLMQSAEEWQALHLDPGALLQGARLAQAEEWLAGHPDPSPLLREFVQASVATHTETERRELARQQELRQQAEARAEAEAQVGVEARRSAMRMRLFASALAALLVVAVAAGASAYRQQVLEKSRKLAAQSGELLSGDHGQALDLAIRSWRVAKTEEARLAVARAFPEPLGIFRHEGAVAGVTFSPDGQRILSASYDHTARIWNAADGRLLATLQGHTNKLTEADFSPDGQRIVTASFDHTARIWDGADGRLLAVLRGHTNWIWHTAFSPDGRYILTASYDHTARIWNAADGQLLSTLQHGGEVPHAEFSPDGKRIVTASWDRTARVWSSADGRLLTTLSGHTGELIHAMFSPDGRRIVTASTDHTARVWDSVSGRALLILQHKSWTIRAKFTADGQRVVTATSDGIAGVWNSIDGHLLFTLQHNSRILDFQFSPDGRHIVTESDDHTARVWSDSDGRLLATLQGSTGAVLDAAFSPSRERIVTGSADGTVRVWGMSAAISVAILRGHSDVVSSLAFSPDGQRIVTASADHTARVWNAMDGRLLTTLQGHTDKVWTAQFSPDGRRIVTGSTDGTSRVWNAMDGRLLMTLQGWTAQFSPDGQRIVTASADHTARVWNAMDGRLLATLHGHTDKVWSARFSPDGRRIVTASLDHTARVWNAMNGHVLTTLHGHTDRVRTAQFSPDGQRIVTASLDNTALLWSAADGSLLSVLRTHTDVPPLAQFSPDGQRIVTIRDHMALVLSATDGSLLVTLQGHTAPVSKAQFSSDGQRIITTSADNTVRIWSAADGHLLLTLGHVVQAWAAQFSPDGQRVVTVNGQEPLVWQILTLDDIERILN
jgi:WD40 repeat protein/DNA-binding winged helix-turn-helix (wHTH) protein